MFMKILIYYYYVLWEEVRHSNFMIFQVQEGDLLIQSAKIIGFFKETNIIENSLIFHRAVSIISTDHDKFNLRESDVSGSDDDESACTNDSSPKRHSDTEWLFQEYFNTKKKLTSDYINWSSNIIQMERITAVVVFTAVWAVEIDIYATGEEKMMILKSVKLHTSENYPLPPRVAYFIFSHAWTKMAIFMPETLEENPLFRVHTKNVSQKIRQRQSCTNCRFSQRWSWLPILSSFGNELTFYSPLYDDTSLCKKCRKNHGANVEHAIVLPSAGVIDNFNSSYW